MSYSIHEVIDKLIVVSDGERTSVSLPDDHLIDECERELGIPFRPEYRFFLKNAGNVFFGSIDPLVVAKDRSTRGELRHSVKSALQIGLPADWLPICEDNGNYYCLLDDGRVRYWSHDGTVNDQWSDLAQWIKNVWIDGD